MNIKYLRQDILRCLFFLMCLFTTISSWAGEEYVADGIVYTLDQTNNCATVSGVENKGIKTAVIKKVVQGYKVTSIGQSAFQVCSSLTSITIPSSVTTIEDFAFFYCSSLTSITIPSSVTKIGRGAFGDCSSLTSITIPSSVTSIGYGAFSGCSSLPSIKVAYDNPNYSFVNSALIDKKSSEIVWVVENIEKFCFPSSVTSIGDYAFSGCSSLASITIPSSVTSIGGCAFYGCSSLASITIPSSVTSIGGYAFENCGSLASITIPSSVTSIGDWAFYGCSSLASITIPSSVTSIGNMAFYYCSSLASITIPSSVTSIGNSAFIGCNSLTSIYLPHDIKSLGSHIFNDSKIFQFVMFDCAISKDSPWYSQFYSENNKISDYCAMYFHGDVSKEQDKLTDDYFKAISLVGGYKDKYEALNEEQRRHFDDLVNPQHLMRTFNKSASEIVAYNDSLLEIYDCMLDLLVPNRVDFNMLSQIYEQACQVKYSRNYNTDYKMHDGLIVDASQFSSNAKESSEGSYEGLIDNDKNTYFHSTWTDSDHADEFHYLQIDLRDTYENIVLKYSVRNSPSNYINKGTPKTLHVYVTNTPENEDSWVDLGTRTCTYDFVENETGLLPLDLPAPYQHIRLEVEETMGNSRNNGNLFFYWSELHAYAKYSADTSSFLSDDEYSAFDEARKSAKKDLEIGVASKPTYLALKEQLDNLNAKVANASLADFSKSRYLTLYTDKPMTVPEGMSAAVVVSNGSGIRNDYRYEAGSVIPANTGVLLRSGKGNSFYMPEGVTTEESPADNLLHGTLTDETTDVEGDNKYYKLAYDAETGTKIGFYWGAQDGAPFVNRAHKAFLAIPATASQSLMGISLFDLDNGMTTGITDTETSGNAPLRIYDLNGRRIEKTSLDGLQPGIYVVNGKKMYVK